MTYKLPRRTGEITTTTGTGTLTVGGAPLGYQSFNSGVGDGNQCAYMLLSGNKADWEYGIGKYTNSGTTLTRATILASSNSGSAISLVGTSFVFVTDPDPTAYPQINPRPTQAGTGFTSWLNQPAGSTVTDSQTGITVFGTAQASVHNKSLIQMTAPATPYNLDFLVALSPTTWNTSFSILDIGWSDGTKLLLAELQSQLGGVVLQNLESSTVTETAVTIPSLGGAASITLGIMPMIQMWVRLNNDGTNLKLSMGSDGANFPFLMINETITHFLVNANKVVFGVDAYSVATTGSILQFRQS